MVQWVSAGEGFRDFFCSKVAEIPDALRRALVDLKSRVLPDQEENGQPWDNVRFELWNDTGRIIVFPAKEPYDDRIDVGGVQVICEEVFDLIHEAIFGEMTESEHVVLEDTLSKQIAGFVYEVAAQDLDCEYGVYFYGEEQIYAA